MIAVEIPITIKSRQSQSQISRDEPSRRFKSKFSKGKKLEVESKREDYDKLYYRINKKKTGRSEANYLEWERSWKNVKILQFPANYAKELRSGQRAKYTVEQILARNRMLPEVDTDSEFWLRQPSKQRSLKR